MIEDGIAEAAAELGERVLFCGDPARQVGPEYYYAGGGAAFPVTDLASARKALKEIVEQGEGDMRSMFDEDADLAHYYRFKELKHRRSYVASDDFEVPSGPPVDVDYTSVFPMIANPRGDEYADHVGLRTANEAVNRTWSQLLLQIEAAFNGAPAALLPAVANMFRLRDQMLVLLANPFPGNGGRNAGPTFDWDPSARASLELAL
jgi:hypothetical protein